MQKATVSVVDPVQDKCGNEGDDPHGEINPLLRAKAVRANELYRAATDRSYVDFHKNSRIFRRKAQLVDEVFHGLGGQRQFALTAASATRAKGGREEGEPQIQRTLRGVTGVARSKIARR